MSRHRVTCAAPVHPALRPLLLSLLLGACVTRLLVGQVSGSPAEVRAGFWLGGGLGQGYTEIRCAICAGDRPAGGLSGYVRAGGTLSPQVLLGGEVTGWTGGEEEVGERFTMLSVAAWWYPNPSHGWYVKLGVGHAWYQAREDEIALTERVLGAQFGAGYDMRVNPVLSVSPFVTLVASPNGNLHRERDAGGAWSAERVARDANLVVLQIGVGITRH